VLQTATSHGLTHARTVGDRDYVRRAQSSNRARSASLYVWDETSTPVQGPPAPAAPPGPTASPALATELEELEEDDSLDDDLNFESFDDESKTKARIEKILMSRARKKSREQTKSKKKKKKKKKKGRQASEPEESEKEARVEKKKKKKSLSKKQDLMRAEAVKAPQPTAPREPAKRKAESAVSKPNMKRSSARVVWSKQDRT
jgi:hypothetical protein